MNSITINFDDNTDINTAYVPIGRIVKTGGLAAVVKYYDELGTQTGEALYLAWER